MPPWALFDTAKDYYVTLAHEAVHWVRGRRGVLNDSVDDDPLLYTREDLIAEVGAAFLCADLAISNVPLDNQVLYVNDMRPILGDPVLAVLGVAEEAARTVGWLHQQAPGYRVEEGATYRSAPPGPDSVAEPALDMAREARRFVADAQALRESHSGRDAAWLAETVRVLDAANRIDLGVDGVEVAIQAAVFLSGGDEGDGVVEGRDYIEGVRRNLRREIRAAVSEDILQVKNDRSRPTGWRL